MVFCVLTIYHDIVEVCRAESIQIRSESLIDVTLEGGRSTGESERND